MNPLAALGVVALLAALGTSGVGPTPAPGPAPEATEPGTFHVYHYGSHVEGEAFREVFLVHALEGLEVSTDDVEIWRDGAPLEVTWDDVDGQLSIDDTFWFVQEAFDQKQMLTGFVDGGQVMECRFGGGAGLTIHPDEWLALGHPEQVRCLQFTRDQ